MLSYNNDTSPVKGGDGNAGESPMRPYTDGRLRDFSLGWFQPGAVVQTDFCRSVIRLRAELLCVAYVLLQGMAARCSV